MDYCKGGELEGYLKERKFLSEKESKNIFKQIYNKVKYIHIQNIIHLKRIIFYLKTKRKKILFRNKIIYFNENEKFYF